MKTGGRRPVPQSADGADLTRHRFDHRFWGPCAGGRSDSRSTLNSPETAIYSKGRTLYGLNLTKSAIRQVNFAVLVEGYFDFAQVFQSQAAPVVASCGTALTISASAVVASFHDKSRPELRPGRGRPRRGRTVFVNCWSPRDSTSTLPSSRRARIQTPSFAGTARALSREAADFAALSGIPTGSGV